MPDFGTVKVPVGPQHPSLKEPESFLITLRGEKITAASVRMGYNHRGVEKGAESRTYTQDLYLIERICGICSHAHATCFIQAVEEVAGLDVPRRGKYIRMLMAELERLHSHFLWLGVAGHEIGFDTLLMYSWRDREIVMDLLAEISGNRVHYSMNTFGGVRRDVTPAVLEKVLAGMTVLEERTRTYIQLCQEELTLIKRLSGVGVVTREDALRLHVVGPTGRASGIARDIRKDDPYLAYDELDFKVVTSDHCDVYGRTLVRVGELMESYSLIRQIVARMPDGPIAVKAPRKVPAGEAFGRYEAPRGEDVHYVRSNGTEMPERVKVRAPTLANLQAVSHMLQDGHLADMPIVIAAIDPCFSCTDRSVSVTRSESGRSDTLDWGTLRRRGIEFHRGRGVDFAGLNRILAARGEGR